ncbi:hypothetical protein WJX73_005661 [Symbiochloris irregularis]|uniref:Uncharacterized protein n=1 Tax=Symbiochloris irregularis TaxID=706552 RepID=A0AAW1NPC7_9CHLO
MPQRKVGKAAVLPQAPSWTLGNRLNCSHIDSGPGPGTYQPRQSFSSQQVHSPAATLAASRPFQSGAFGEPAPGSYNPSVKLTKQAAASWTLRHRSSPAFTLGSHISSPRRLSTGQETPGPSAYSVKADAVLRGTRASSFGRAGASAASTAVATPGPGTYNPDAALARLRSRSKAVSIGSRLPAGGEHSATPGPGSYLVTRGSSTPAVTMKFRHDRGLRNPDLPGPGATDLPTARSGPAYTIAERLASSNRDNFPGPGQYDHE